MKKIQITTVPKEANVEIIELSSYFVARVARIQCMLEPMVKAAMHVKTKFNEQTNKREEVLDENGNKIYEYREIDSQFIAEQVLPFFNEICEAFEE